MTSEALATLSVVADGILTNNELRIHLQKGVTLKPSSFMINIIHGEDTKTNGCLIIEESGRCYFLRYGNHEEIEIELDNPNKENIAVQVYKIFEIKKQDSYLDSVCSKLTIAGFTAEMRTVKNRVNGNGEKYCGIDDGNDKNVVSIGIRDGTSLILWYKYAPPDTRILELIEFSSPDWFNQLYKTLKTLLPDRNAI